MWLKQTGVSGHAGVAGALVGSFLLLLASILPAAAVPSLAACDDLRRHIVKANQDLATAYPRYKEIAAELDKLDKQTRVSMCTRHVDAFTDVGTLEFDDSWRAWLSNKLWWASWLNEIPAEMAGPQAAAAQALVSETLDVMGKTLDLFTAHEREQLPLDEAVAVYKEIRKTRAETLGNMQRMLQHYYCRKIFATDVQLYNFYNHDIPRHCPPEQVVNVQRLVMRGRPSDLGPIWVERNYQASAKLCADIVPKKPVIQAAPTPAGKLAEKYTTSFGVITFTQRDGSGASGTYHQGKSRIQGSWNGNILKGTWHQENSARDCGGGSYYGQFEFEFSDSRKSFTGKWSYCNDAPADAWNGNAVPPRR